MKTEVYTNDALAEVIDVTDDPAKLKQRALVEIAVKAMEGEMTISEAIDAQKLLK